MSAGITDHLSTNASPPRSSSTKTNKFVRMMQVVTMGKCTGRRDASLRGIKPPNCFPSFLWNPNQIERQVYGSFYCTTPSRQLQSVVGRQVANASNFAASHE